MSDLKYFEVCCAFWSTFSGSTPIISTMRTSRSCSEAPGNSGSPRNSSAAMQPSDHMSMATSYGWPISTCTHMLFVVVFMLLFVFVFMLLFVFVFVFVFTLSFVFVFMFFEFKS